MPGSPLREYLLLAIILALIVAFVWDHISGIRAGVARQVAADIRVAQAAQRAVEAQKLVDARTAQEATHGLETELATLKRNAAEPKSVRLCVSPARRPVPPAPEPAGGTPSPAPAAGLVPEVPSGAGAGPEIGAELQQLATAADVLAARDRACIAWAQGIAK